MRTIIPSKTRTSLYSATAINRTNGVEAAPTFSPHAINHTTTTNYNMNNNNNDNNNEEFDKLNGNNNGISGGGGGGASSTTGGGSSIGSGENNNLPVSATTGAAIRITENPLPENVAC